MYWSRLRLITSLILINKKKTDHPTLELDEIKVYDRAEWGGGGLRRIRLHFVISGRFVDLILLCVSLVYHLSY